MRLPKILGEELKKKYSVSVDLGTALDVIKFNPVSRSLVLEPFGAVQAKSGIHVVTITLQDNHMR